MAPPGPGAPHPAPAAKGGKGPLIALIAAAVLLVIALAVSFIPFPHSSDGGPTAAFRAQQELDKVVFKFGQTAGAKFSGTLKYTYTTSTNPTEDSIEFKNLVVSSANNSEGTIKLDTQEAQYRQIGNNVYANGPKEFWTKLIPNAPTSLDLDSVASKWADTDGTGLLWLGSFLSPRKLAGRLAIGDSAASTSLGQELPAPNNGLPDARFWPTSDPKVTMTGNSITVGSMTTTFDPESKEVTHIKGSSTTADGIKYTIDTDVAPMTDNDREKLFANERSFAPELLAVPAPGIGVRDPMMSAVSNAGSCTSALCQFAWDLQGKLRSDTYRTGYINYGMNVSFTANGNAVASPCSKVVRVDFGSTTRANCDAVNLGNLPNGTSIRANVSNSKYLPFNTKTSDNLSNIIDKNEAAAKQQITLVRTGTKRPGDATKYNYQITDMPSVYAVKQGDYEFDGFGPAGSFLITLSTGYDQHVNGGVFDPNWAGTKTLLEQAKQQVAAAGNIHIVWFTAEENTATAAKALLASAGITDQKVDVYYSKLES